MQLDPRRVLQFVAVAERGSYTHAAKELFISQPALTRSIRLLEEQIGGRLLERGRHGAVPTVLGQSLLAHGQRVRASLSRASDDLGDVQRGIRGHLVIGTTPLAVAVFLPRALRRFLDGRDAVSVEVLEDLAPSLVQRLQRGELDLFLGPTDLGWGVDGITSRFLFEDHLVCVVRSGHPLAGRAEVTREDLGRAWWILPGRSGSLRQRVQHLLAASDIAELQVRVETDSIRVTVALMTSGEEVALVPFEMVREELRAGTLVELVTPLRSLARPIGVHVRGDEAPPALVAALIASFSDYAEVHGRVASSPNPSEPGR